MAGKRRLTNAGEGEGGGGRGVRGGALDGGGAAEEDEAGAVALGGGDGGEGVAAARTRGVVGAVPAGLLQRAVCWRRHHPGLLSWSWRCCRHQIIYANTNAESNSIN